MRRAILACASILLVARVGVAVQISAGDIVAPQYDNSGTVIVIHPQTGSREILSLYPSIGQGPRMSRPTSIARLPDGNFLITDTFVHETLTRVDAATGNRTDITTGDFQAVLLDGGDPILVGDGSIYRVDLATGQKTLISGQGVGSGPEFQFGGAGGAALGSNGHVLIAAYNAPAIYDVNLVTGARSILSGLGHGSGPALSHLMDLVVLPNGQIIAEGRHYEVGINELFRIDPSTGNRTIITSHSSNTEYERLALGYGGNLLGSMPYQGSVVSINPATGATVVISGSGVGTGPALGWGDMVVVPEPTGLAQAVSVFVVWLVTGTGWRRGYARTPS